MSKMTLKLAKHALKAIDVTITKKDGEYRVNLLGGTEATAYYSDDIEDAFRTGIAMRAHVVSTKKN